MIYYLILAHNNLNQLEILVNKLKTDNSEIYIHLDKKIKNFKEIKSAHYIKNRQDISRGWTKMIEAELIWLFEIEKHMKEWDHVVIISWQCFPIKKMDYIENYINELGNKSCIDYQIASKNMVNARITWYHFYDTKFHIPKKINDVLIKFLSFFKNFDTSIKVPVINVIISKIVSFILPKRKFLTKNFKIYYWSQRMILSEKHIRFIKKFLESDKWRKTKKSFAYTAICDEIFFQTICCNLINHDELIKNTLRYIKWENWKASPKNLSINDLNEIKKSDKLFARKFNISFDAKILTDLNNL